MGKILPGFERAGFALEDLAKVSGGASGVAKAEAGGGAASPGFEEVGVEVQRGIKAIDRLGGGLLAEFSMAAGEEELEGRGSSVLPSGGDLSFQSGGGFFSGGGFQGRQHLVRGWARSLGLEGQEGEREKGRATDHASLVGISPGGPSCEDSSC